MGMSDAMNRYKTSNSCLLPCHHLCDGDFAPEDEARTMGREILSCEIRLDELLDVRRKVVWEDGVRAKEWSIGIEPTYIRHTGYSPRG